MEKLELLDAVKKESKKLMEEAVTKKFVHTDSCAVTSFCAAIESCLLHKLKKRIGGLLPSASSDEVLVKLSKFCESGEMIMQLAAKIQSPNNKINSDLNLDMVEVRKISRYTLSTFSTKYLWIRLALVEKVLPNILMSLADNWREFYEPDAILADQVHGPSLFWLLDGPSSLDYSKMKTPESTWTDPTAYELVQRHRIYSSPNMSHNLKPLLARRKRLFTISGTQSQPSLNGIPSVAREHVDSLHQNAVTTLLYGKNNVELSLSDGSCVQGYLSLHKSLDSLLLKWTPNPMLCTNEVQVFGEKSKYWDQVLTIDFADIVYLHCHYKGESGGSFVLISHDGVQLPPLSFPSSGSLLSFISCLEQGLLPEGRLDPPLMNTPSNLINWPKFKKTLLPDKLMNHLDLDKKNEKVEQDYVFRILTGTTSQIDKNDLKKLLSTNNSTFHASNMNLSHNKNSSRKPLPPRHHMKRLSRNDKPQTLLSLNLACEKMKHQLIARAFHGWLASYRHLKTVRTHLASLVHPCAGATYDDDIQALYDKGLTKEIWYNMKNEGLSRNRTEVKKYVYYGGVEHSIREEVWPYLLEHHSFVSSPQHINEQEKRALHSYTQLLQECKSIEGILQEKEKDLLALNGFANGETFANCGDSETMSLKTNDYVDHGGQNGTLDDTLSRELSVTSDHISESVSSNDSETGPTATREISIMTSLLETTENLRDIVENASKRGADAWKNLTKKKKRDVKKELEKNDVFHSTPVRRKTSFDELHGRLNPSQSFDLEIECHSCGKKIIESKETMLKTSKDATDNNEVIECFSCKVERENTIVTSIPPYNLTIQPTTVYDNRMDHLDGSTNGDNTEYILINGEGALLKQRESLSSVSSSYSEDILKDFALNIHRIDKDVLRCDRNHPFFVPEKNLEKLRNIMMCYVWERLNVGYIQGMCDLCAPLLVIIDDEAKVFNCFVKLMDRMSNNFPQGTAMDRHLSNINSLIQILDPELSELLQVHDDNTVFYFCYRWFLLDFKRELQYEDVFLVWETIWSASSVSSDHFNLFVALAIIELYREIIIDNRMDFTDIIKFFNEMAEQHDARATLNLARNIVHKLQDVLNVNDAIEIHDDS